MKLIKIAKTCLLATLLGVSACSDVSTVTSPVFIIRGKAMTGAHTRSPVAGGFVGLITPAPNKWMRLDFASNSGIPNKAVTASDGSFTFTVKVALITDSTYSIFLGVSDSDGTFTMLSEIPRDLAVEGAQVPLDINPTTTAASDMICPGGINPPTTSGAYCYSDPNKPSTTRSSMMEAIDISLAGTNTSLNVSTPPNWQTFINTLLSDTTAFNLLKAIATAAGLTSTGFTATAIQTAVGSASVPLVTKPVYGVDDNTPPPASSSSDSCEAIWSCGSSSQCAQVMGAAHGTKTGFSGSEQCNAWCQEYIPGGCHCSGC